MKFSLSPGFFNIPAVITQRAAVTEEDEGPPRVVIFSNVRYNINRKLVTRPEDILVFLNSAVSAEFYRNDRVRRKICYHRSKDLKHFGPPIDFCANRYVNRHIPLEFRERLKAEYDWDYPSGPGDHRSMTTGYIVAMYLAEHHSDREIVLVNFGSGARRDTYRAPDHNWEFEEQQLQQFRHIWLAERVDT